MADIEGIRTLKEFETEIINDFTSLSENLKKDLANIWYDREQEEINEIRHIRERLRNSAEFIKNYVIFRPYRQS